MRKAESESERSTRERWKYVRGERKEKKRVKSFSISKIQFY